MLKCWSLPGVARHRVVHCMSAATPSPGHCLGDNVYLPDLRQQMLKFARLQLRDNSAAEDVLQDALIGAMKNADMLSCYKATALISLSHERPLVFREKASLRLHLMICSMCRNFQAISKTLCKAMAKFTRLP